MAAAALARSPNFEGSLPRGRGAYGAMTRRHGPPMRTIQLDRKRPVSTADPRTRFRSMASTRTRTNRSVPASSRRPRPASSVATTSRVAIGLQPLGHPFQVHRIHPPDHREKHVPGLPIVSHRIRVALHCRPRDLPYSAEAQGPAGRELLECFVEELRPGADLRGRREGRRKPLAPLRGPPKDLGPDPAQRQPITEDRPPL